jgi:alpha-beta hydrolase superfamily lysophospholipase
MNAIPQWWPTRDGAIFGWTHPPLAAPRTTAVVLVPPLGPEYLHSHRAVRHLARRLARAGYPVVRYDHPGYGDATPVPREANAVPLWQDAVTTALAVARAMTGVERVVLVTLRSSMLLLAQPALAPVDGVVCWYPVVRGSAFVRDLQRLDAALGLPPTDGTHLEAGGYSMSTATQQGLGALDVVEGLGVQPRAAFLIHEEGLPPNPRLAERLLSAGAEVREVALGGRPGMMRQAELMQVPEGDVAAIVTWMMAAFPERAAAADGTDVDADADADADDADRLPVEPVAPPVLTAQLDGGAWRERPVWLGAGERRAFGILTEPITEAPTPRPLFVLLNAGSAHHVGPNGMHPLLCRRAAQEGWTALRLDIPGLGESSRVVARETHHPYPTDVGPMLWRVLAPLARQAGNRLVLAGLCSGARNAYKTALAAGAGCVRGLILLNPLTLYFQPGDDILLPAAARPGADAQWLQSGQRDRGQWRALLGNPRRVWRVGARAVRAIARWGWRRAVDTGRRLGMMPPPLLVRDLHRLLDARTHITLMTHAGEPGVQAIRLEAGALLSEAPAPRTVRVRLLAAADHTFTRRDSRDELTEQMMQALREAIA